MTNGYVMVMLMRKLIDMGRCIYAHMTLRSKDVRVLRRITDVTGATLTSRLYGE